MERYKSEENVNNSSKLISKFDMFESQDKNKKNSILSNPEKENSNFNSYLLRKILENLENLKGTLSSPKSNEMTVSYRPSQAQTHFGTIKSKK